VPPAGRGAEKKKEEAIESWTRYFLSLRESHEEPAARFVLKKIGLDIYDDHVGERFFEMFSYYRHTKAEKEKLFLDLISHNFDAYQLERYRDIFSRMANIFSDFSCPTFLAQERHSFHCRILALWTTSQITLSLSIILNNVKDQQRSVCAASPCCIVCVPLFVRGQRRSSSLRQDPALGARGKGQCPLCDVVQE
jgi:hypothetical protein